MFESTVVGSVLGLPGIGSNVKVFGNEVGWASVCEV